MPTIRIDNKTYQVKEGQNLLHAVLSLGLDIPYFCWHPSLGSVGSCRLCAVQHLKDENDTQGRMVMSCMTPATEGMCISIDHPQAKAFRESVIEWLMTNHPHDCPVCDEGGECHLQDMTVMSGHNYRRYRFKKRTFKNQYLGPFINHEMNRCITCYRCVRFYRDIAGGKDLNSFASSNRVYFGRHESGVLESEFSGNLVEVCPTGVFTDKTYKKQYTRKWDLQTAPSVCHSCGLGCNIIPGERYGTLRRIVNRYNYDVNGYFICDRGRFGYQYVNSNQRVKQPLLKTSKNQEQAQTISRIEAVDKMKSALASGKGVLGIGSPRASMESNFALRKLVGKDNFFSGMSSTDYKLVNQILNILQNGPAHTPTIKEVEDADVVLVLGEDLINTGARLALAIRQSVKNVPVAKAVKSGIPEWNDAAIKNAIQQDKGPLFLATLASTSLDEIATDSFYGTPDEIARFGHAVARELDGSLAPVEGVSEQVLQLAKKVAQTLQGAERPMIISGISLHNQGIVEAAANISWSLCHQGKPAGLSYVLPEVNSLGLGILGGQDLEKAIQMAKEGKVQCAVILENDLYRRANAETISKFLESIPQVIVLDSLSNLTANKAEVLIPVSTFAEGTGTVISSEGRAQRYYRVYAPQEPIQEGWRWIRDCLHGIGRGQEAKWENLDAISDAVCAEFPLLAPIQQKLPRADMRINNQKIAREMPAYSGRTAMNANKSVHEPKPPVDPDSPFSHSMEGFNGIRPADVLSFYWQPGWNSVQSLNKFQSEVAGHLVGGDPGVRLIAPKTGTRPTPFTFQSTGVRPQAAGPLAASGECFVVPFYHIFGSEELSVHTPSLAERIPAPYLAMNAEDLKDWGLGSGQTTLKLTLNGRKYRLATVAKPGLPRGVVGLPVGLPDSCWEELPAVGQIAKETP